MVRRAAGGSGERRREELVGGCGGSGTTRSPTRTRAKVEPGSAGLEALAKRLRLPHKAVLLMRTRARLDKQVLSLLKRWESVRGAFATRPGSQVDNLRVLLLDDVLTTGATLDACARALRDARAKSVVGLTVARAVGNPCRAPDSGKIGRRRRDGHKPAHVGGLPGALHP